MGRYRETITCKGCPGIFSCILKHLAQNKECKNHYSDDEIDKLRKSSRKMTLLDQAYKQTSEYDKEKRAKRYQEKKKIIAEKYKRDKQKLLEIRKSNCKKIESKEIEFSQMSRESQEKVAWEIHFTLKERTRKQFKDCPYLSKSKHMKLMALKEKSKNIAKSLDNQIENASTRAKHLEFSQSNVSRLFNHLMDNIENEWIAVNEKISNILKNAFTLF